MATKPTAEKKASRRKKVEVSREQIAARAYELYRSGVAGDELAHWLMAEDELLGRRAA
jgi:hypothetical protein